jgi:hypothetical protein
VQGSEKVSLCDTFSFTLGRNFAIADVVDLATGGYSLSLTQIGEKLP